MSPGRSSVFPHFSQAMCGAHGRVHLPGGHAIFLQVTWLDPTLPSGRGTNQSLFPCPTRMPSSLAHPRLDLCSLPVVERHGKPVLQSIERFQRPEKSRKTEPRCQDISPRISGMETVAAASKNSPSACLSISPKPPVPSGDSDDKTAHLKVESRV